MDFIKAMNIQNNISLKEFTTFRIGGNAKYFVKVTNIEDLKNALIYAKKNNLKTFILAKGSNVVFDDRGFDGLVILNKIDFINFHENEIETASGTSVAKFAIECSKRNLSGFEFAAPLPGSVGGAVYMNAGANNQQTFDTLINVTYLNENFEIINFKKEDINFGYRYSIFQEMKGVILSAKFKLEYKENIIDHQRDLIKKRTLTQPINTRNCGCIFKNPENNFAAKLIDECDLKGFKIGGAKISEKHANFIVNENNAKASDVLNLIKHVKNIVYKKKNIRLHEEVRLIPYRGNE
ncbi:MAG: UDP-N-acetylenolpyruvoylglucosamine reductase [Candidatus Anoxychlamydiales bacterium]|nr:UDP-N-acetylenolpyruvoylglucosamine reductase [Candidatus Anoxychlamydiales bacterium]